MTKSIKKQTTSRKNSSSTNAALAGFDKTQMALLYPQLAAAALAANPLYHLNPLQLAMTANLLQQQQQQQQQQAASSSAAKQRAKSRSTTTDTSSATTHHNTTAESVGGRGGGGLKLVLKRQQGDKYEVKPVDETATSANGRPKRQAARKVKFTFSEYDTDSSPEKKRPKLAWSASLANAPTTAVAYHHQQHQPKRSLSSSMDIGHNFVKISQHHDTERNVFVDDDDDEDETESDDDDEEEEEEDEVEENLFYLSDIVRYNFSDKVNIMLNPPNVILTTTKPFPIALVEDKTNIICTKALIHMHLFQSYGSQCINCLMCNNFLTIAEFSKHLHRAEDDDDEDFNELTKKSFKVLPYRVNKNEELSEADLDVWRTFGKRYARFKQEHLSKLKMLKQQQELVEQQRIKEEISREQSSLVKNWDAISEDKQIYSVSREKLLFNQVVVETSTRHVAERRLSQDDDEEEAAEEKKKEVATKPEEKVVTKTTTAESTVVVDDLSLSEDEEEDEEVEQEVVAEERRLKLPTMQERYVNLYDNMNQSDLLSICDNAITIIPDSFIDYMIGKHQSNMVNLKLAKDSLFKLMWLSQSLDLECSKPADTIQRLHKQQQQ